MRGPSRAAFAQAHERLAAVVADRATAGTLSEDLFAVSALLDREPGLRRALSDATSPRAARTALVRSLLGGRVSRIALDQLVALVSDRWSVPSDLADAIEQLAVLASAAAADDAGLLDNLEDELFRFGRIVSSSPELRSALSNPRLPDRRKRALLDALLAAKVIPASLRLITQAAVHPRGRSLDASLDEYARLAAGWRQRLIAIVRVAAELTDSQRERLAAALSAAYGRGIHLNVVFDPTVMGGISIQVGDEFIDGSVASRLAELRRRMAA